MKQTITKNLILNYQDGLDDFVNTSINIVDEKTPLIKEIFECNDICVGQLKASFFTDRNDFVNYISSISGGHTPPSWATGCFYNGEIQTLIDLNKKENLEYQTHTLIHEIVHLYFNKLIYNKYEIYRIRWFDESYACYIDGHIENIKIENLKEICVKLKSLNDFDMNTLDNIKNVRTNNYNGYDMFLTVGKYIFENNLEKKYLKILKNNPKKIRKIGLKILSKAISYVENLN